MGVFDIYFFFLKDAAFINKIGVSSSLSTMYVYNVNIN